MFRIYIQQIFCKGVSKGKAVFASNYEYSVEDISEIFIVLDTMFTHYRVSQIVYGFSVSL